MCDSGHFQITNNNQAELDGNRNRASSYGMNSEACGAIGVSYSGPESDLEIIDLDAIESAAKDDETWLFPSSSESDTKSQKTFTEWITCDIDPGESTTTSKKSLVNKLEIISKGSPTRFSSSSSSYMSSPGPPSYFARHNLSSTPLAKNTGRTQFDSRTFSRASGTRALLNRTYGCTDDSSDGILSSSPVKLNQTSFLKFNSPHLLNTTFDKELTPSSSSPGIRMNETYDQKSYFRLASPRIMNSTYDKDASPGLINATFRKDESPFNATYRKDDLNSTYEVRNSGGNSTFDVRNSGGNATFEIRPSADGRKLSEDRLSSTSSNSNVDHFHTHRLSRDSSHDMLDEDRLSTTSESSVSHRLNDVGDVQQIARMQEESLRQPILPPSHRSATISPSSEHSANSPSTEGYMTGNNLGYQSEEGGAERGAIGGGGGHHYSSQDSLPDSPYSSQSLDVQPLSEQDRLRRSMPNLNKIRGHSNRGGMGGGGGVPLNRGPGGGPSQRPSYGALSRQHNSDPRLQAGSSRLRFQAPPPSRGTTVSSSNEYSGSNQRLLQPRQYGYSQPQVSNQSQGWAQPLPPKTGIPRPGSRIPGPRTISGIPKPGGAYSQPGSRASSLAPRKMSADNYY